MYKVFCTGPDIMIIIICVQWWKDLWKLHTFVMIEDSATKVHSKSMSNLGEQHVSKSDEFSEKFRTAFAPPPHHFRKVILRFLRQNCDKSVYVHMEEHLCILRSYFPWDACSTNVQHCNRVKTYPKKTFLYHFHGQKALFKGPNFAI